MPKITVSYRRTDADAITGRIFDRLAQHYGRESVFRDIDNIPPGSDFRDYIDEALKKTSILLVIIGPKWLGARAGQTRISDETDPVRIEVEGAMRRGIPVIPVLVGNTRMPGPAQLPESLRKFAYHNALKVDPGQDFDHHSERLIRAMDRLLAEIGGSQSVDAARSPAAQPQIPAAEARREMPAPRAETLRQDAQPEHQYECERDRHLFAPGRKRILALDGGGRRSIITIAFLAHIEELLTQYFGKPARLGDWFDFIGSTSTGAIIAAAIALGLPMEEIRESFERLAAGDGGRSFWPFSDGGENSPENLREELQRLVGDRMLSSSELITGLCVITKRADTGSPWLVTNNPRASGWESPFDKKYPGNKYYKLSNLIRASVATRHSFDPVLLPIVEGVDQGYFVDGALSPHSNPSLALFFLTTLSSWKVRWRTGPDNLTIVSIGAGAFRRSFAPDGPRSRRSLAPPNEGLLSLSDDFQKFVLAQMQWLGEEPAPWAINSEIAAIGNDGPPGGKLFRFLRYDLRLELAWLAQECETMIPERELEGLRSGDGAEALRRLYEIGRKAAEKQVKLEHLL
jgi:predicted acylesterase/phospholipase RssA